MHGATVGADVFWMMMMSLSIVCWSSSRDSSTTTIIAFSTSSYYSYHDRFAYDLGWQCWSYVGTISTSRSQFDQNGETKENGLIFRAGTRWPTAQDPVE
jgi:hypothetical protein